MPNAPAPNRARRRTTRPKLAERDAFESALRKVAEMPPKLPAEDVAADYLPRFVSKLRELGYKQDDIVKTIVGLNLGVTERQIRKADSAWSKSHGGSAEVASSAASSSDGTGGAKVVGADHAGLSGSSALRRTTQTLGAKA